MSDVRNEDANPYAPPQVVGAEPRIPILRFHPGEALHAERRSGSSWPLRRRIRFRGEYDFELAWHAGLVESVTIDGETSLRVTNLSSSIIPKFEIPVFAGRDALLTVEARTKLYWLTVYFVAAFRVRLDDRTLYAEGEWPEESPERAPSPALSMSDPRDSKVVADF